MTEPGRNIQDVIVRPSRPSRSRSRKREIKETIELAKQLTPFLTSFLNTAWCRLFMISAPGLPRPRRNIASLKRASPTKCFVFAACGGRTKPIRQDRSLLIPAVCGLRKKPTT